MMNIEIFRISYDKQIYTKNNKCIVIVLLKVENRHRLQKNATASDVPWFTKTKYLQQSVLKKRMRNRWRNALLDRLSSFA